MTNELWDQWADCHDDFDQIKRKDSAKKTTCTPVKIDFTRQTGDFKGSHGRYVTTLDKCTCVDFSRRKLPCKHMYRLAMELGLMDENFASNLANVAEPKQNLSDTIAVVENLPEKAQLLLKNILCNMNSSFPDKCISRSPELSLLLESEIIVETNSPLKQLNSIKFYDLKKRLSDHGYTQPFRKKLEMINWILLNVPDLVPELCYDSAVVCASEHIKVQKVYSYLYRKYEAIPALLNDSFISFIPYDDVTKLLVKNGYVTLEQLDM